MNTEIVGMAVEGTTKTVNNLIDSNVFLGFSVIVLIILLAFICFFIYLQGKNNKEAMEQIKSAYSDGQKLLIEENRSLREHNVKLLESKKINKKGE